MSDQKRTPAQRELQVLRSESSLTMADRVIADRAEEVASDVRALAATVAEQGRQIQAMLSVIDVGDMESPGSADVSLQQLQDEIGSWGDATFPNSTIDTVIAHLAEEVTEFFDDYRAGKDSQEEELADVLILMLHFAHKSFFSLAESVESKMAVNRARVWNTKPEPGGHFKHVESPGIAEAAPEPVKLTSSLPENLQSYLGRLSDLTGLSVSDVVKVAIALEQVPAPEDASPEPVGQNCGHHAMSHPASNSCVCLWCDCKSFVSAEQAVQEPPALDPVLVKSINELCDLVDWLAHGTVHMIGTGMCGEIFARTTAIRAFGADAREGGAS